VFISVSKNVIFQFFFGCFFFDCFPFFSARRKRTTFGSEGTRYIGTEGKGCQLGGCKEGGKKDSEGGKKNFWGFCFSAAGGYQSFNLWFFLSFLLLLLLLLTSFW